jgi:acyl-CoA synthetase (AMP-forming)/AMP-acid ligase II
LAINDNEGRISDKEKQNDPVKRQFRYVPLVSGFLGVALSFRSLEIQGCVGQPLPFIQIKIRSDDGKDVTKIANVPGMLYISGPQVFKEYWNLPDRTAMRSRKLVGNSGLSLGITRR